MRTVDTQGTVDAGGRPPGPTVRRLGRRALGNLTQAQIVFGVALVLVVIFSLMFDSFLTAGNLLSMGRSVSALGVLAIAMAVVMIGRGIDLSLVATMGMAVTVSLQHLGDPSATYLGAALLGLALCLAMGLLNGVLVAFVEIPPLFVTFASGLLVIGLTRTFIAKSYVLEVPPGRDLVLALGRGDVFGIPRPLIVLVVVAIAVHLVLSRTIIGKYLYAVGDNPTGAALTGVPVRPLLVIKYTAAATLSYISGLIIVGAVGGFDSTVVQGTYIFDVLTVVIIGGVSLAGARGNVFSVLAGLLLIGVMLNGMTLMNLSVYTQNIAKGIILLGALILDRRLHPFDPETARQAD